MPPSPQPPEAGRPTVESFLKAVLRSGLLNRDSLQATLRSMPAERRQDREAVAEHLVRADRLTRFQARKLLQDTATGLVLGPYHVLAPIAKGGMGTVYLARDVRSTHLVALKVLPPRKAREEDRILARFRREMEMCQRVSHPHLAWTYDVGVHKGVYFIAMEYIPGRSLFRVVVEEGPLAPGRVARLFTEVALALDHTHSQGLVHRDLKPSNIIITPNDHAKLLDLGLALVVGERLPVSREVLGGQGYIVGTMDYIAPEQTDDSTKVDSRADIYALGCSMYFALCGQPPFPGGNARDKIQRHRTEEPTPLTQLRPQMPPELAALVHGMMAKNPNDRPPSAAFVRRELLHCADVGPGLPLDRPEDPGYQQTVNVLTAQEPANDLVGEALPVPDEPSTERSRPVGLTATPDAPIDTPPAKDAPPRKPARRRPRAAPEPIPPTRPSWLPEAPILVGILVAVGCLLGIIALVVAWLASRS